MIGFEKEVIKVVGGEGIVVDDNFMELIQIVLFNLLIFEFKDDV